jgi:hypothetical protein
LIRRRTLIRILRSALVRALRRIWRGETLRCGLRTPRRRKALSCICRRGAWRGETLRCGLALGRGLGRALGRVLRHSCRCDAWRGKVLGYIF